MKFNEKLDSWDKCQNYISFEYLNRIKNKISTPSNKQKTKQELINVLGVINATALNDLLYFFR